MRLETFGADIATIGITSKVFLLFNNGDEKMNNIRKDIEWEILQNNKEGIENNFLLKTCGSGKTPFIINSAVNEIFYNKCLTLEEFENKNKSFFERIFK